MNLRRGKEIPSHPCLCCVLGAVVSKVRVRLGKWVSSRGPPRVLAAYQSRVCSPL